MQMHPEKTSLEKGFNEFNSIQSLFTTSDRVLLAVSGGIDSVAMLHLFLNKSNVIGVIHCNFQLRSTDSDEDEVFVRNLCNLRQIPFYCKRFNTIQYSEEKKISIQVAAREMRYQYFEEIRLREKYDLVAVAHNSDDTIETFFINLMRGTGIQGLTGIKPKTGKIIRPILFASRKEIETFSEEAGMLHRLDKSNLSNKYKRNKIRNELIPFIETIAPSFRKTILEVMHNLHGTSMIYQSFLHAAYTNLVREEDGIRKIEIKELKALDFNEIVMSELLRDYGFSADVSRNIFGNLEAESGKTYFSPTHRLLKDRTQLLITKRNSEPDESFYIDEDTLSLEFPLLLNIQHENINPAFEIPQNQKIACLDEEKIVFPLILRHWKIGDYFRPLGMDQMKKLSDFFINEKFTVFDKERVWLLVSDGKIVWICGHRIDDRFKIVSDTTKILRIEILD